MLAGKHQPVPHHVQTVEPTRLQQVLLDLFPGCHPGRKHLVDLDNRFPEVPRLSHGIDDSPLDTDQPSSSDHPSEVTGVEAGTVDRDSGAGPHPALAAHGDRHR